jgi:hypothetical protein
MVASKRISWRTNFWLGGPPEWRRGRLIGIAIAQSPLWLAVELIFGLRGERLASNLANWSIGIGIGTAALIGSMLAAVRIARSRAWRVPYALLAGYLAGMLVVAPLMVMLAFRALVSLEIAKVKAPD